MTTEKDTTWSYAQMATLWEQARRHASLREIALVLSKSEVAILRKAKELGVPIDYMWPGPGEQEKQFNHGRPPGMAEVQKLQEQTFCVRGEHGENK